MHYLGRDNIHICRRRRGWSVSTLHLRGISKYRRTVSMLVQLSKSLGLRVIASCGSNEKIGILKDLGADYVINRRTEDMFLALKKAGPIDIYIDHVGGIALEAAIENAAMHARFVICGAVSTYNGPMSNAYGVKVYKNYSNLIILTYSYLLQNLWLINRYRITCVRTRLPRLHPS